MLPPPAAGAPGVRLELERLWHQFAIAVDRNAERRPPGQPLRGDQEIERAPRARVQPPVWPERDGAALLHGLRAVGTARYVADPLRARDHAGQADPGLQPRRHAARLHL